MRCVRFDVRVRWKGSLQLAWTSGFKGTGKNPPTRGVYGCKTLMFTKKSFASASWFVCQESGSELFGQDAPVFLRSGRLETDGLLKFAIIQGKAKDKSEMNQVNNYPFKTLTLAIFCLLQHLTCCITATSATLRATLWLSTLPTAARVLYLDNLSLDYFLAS